MFLPEQMPAFLVCRDEDKDTKKADAFKFFLPTVDEKYEIWDSGSGVDEIQFFCDATKCASWESTTLQNSEKNDAVAFWKDSFLWKFHGIKVIPIIKPEIKSQIYICQKKNLINVWWNNNYSFVSMFIINHCPINLCVNHSLHVGICHR